MNVDNIVREATLAPNFETARSLMGPLIGLAPKMPALWVNIAHICNQWAKYDEGIEAARRAVEIDPQNYHGWFNLGVLLNATARFEEARAAYGKALSLSPDKDSVASCHFNLSMSLLSADITDKQGWAEYHWRFKSSPLCAKIRDRFEAPDWNGEELVAGRKLLGFSEQGMGDLFQFSRYLRPGMICEVQESAVSLLQTSFPDVQVVGRSENTETLAPGPPADYVVSLCDLPGIFGMMCSPAYLKPSKKLTLPKTDKMRIGVCWAGAAAYPNDKGRSIPLRYFDQITMPGIEWWSLQKDSRLKEGATIKLEELSFPDWDDTAALIQELNLIISVDTAVAHLAGAMGKPVWLLAYKPYEFRWGQTGARTPWYPSMRLIRQSVPGDWSSCFQAAQLLLSYAFNNQEKLQN